MFCDELKIIYFEPTGRGKCIIFLPSKPQVGSHNLRKPDSQATESAVCAAWFSVWERGEFDGGESTLYDQVRYGAGLREEGNHCARFATAWCSSVVFL